MVVKCNACGKYISSQDAACINCCKCKKGMHRGCVGVSVGLNVPNWVCPECKIKELRPNSDNTPVKGDDSRAVSSGNIKSKPLAHSGQSDGTAIVTCAAAPNLRDLIDEIRLNREELVSVRQELADIKQMFRSSDLRLDKLEETVQSLVDGAAIGKTDESLVLKLQLLETNIDHLQRNLDDRDQMLLLNDVELSGVPEGNEQNLDQIVLACAAKVGIQLHERELVSCRRVGGVRRNNARPRPIVVRLTRPDVRTQLLQAARDRSYNRKMEEHGSSFTFFVNERLTKKNRELYRLARQAGRSCGWKFVWVRDGRIYARKEFGTLVHRISTEKDLEVFRLKSVDTPGNS